MWRRISRSALAQVPSVRHGVAACQPQSSRFLHEKLLLENNRDRVGGRPSATGALFGLCIVRMCIVLAGFLGALLLVVVLECPLQVVFTD